MRRIVTSSIVAVFLVMPFSGRAEVRAVTRYSHVPLTRMRLTSEFGIREHPVTKALHHHDGIDLAAPVGTPIRAVLGGIVIFSGVYKGYGKLVVIEHDGGRLTTHYAHCDALLVSVGERVLRGAVIARVGRTGRATGAHLHFELRDGGKPIDPLQYIRGQ